jgi:hypothetical protein
MNIEQLLYFMMLCLGKKIPNEPLHLFIIEGVGTSKTFMLMWVKAQ